MQGHGNKLVTLTITIDGKAVYAQEEGTGIFSNMVYKALTTIQHLVVKELLHFDYNALMKEELDAGACEICGEAGTLPITFGEALPSNLCREHAWKLEGGAQRGEVTAQNFKAWIRQYNNPLGRGGGKPRSKQSSHRRASSSRPSKQKATLSLWD